MASALARGSSNLSLVGKIDIPAGSTRYGGGAFKAPDGLIRLGDGVVLPKGSKRLPNNTFELPDGSIKFPDGSTKNLDGTFKMSDGSFKLADGAKLPPGTKKVNGRFKFGDGTDIPVTAVKKANGSFKLPDGSFKITKTTEAKLGKNIDSATKVSKQAGSANVVAKQADDLASRSVKNADEVGGKISKKIDDASSLKKQADEASLKKGGKDAKAKRKQNDVETKKKKDADADAEAKNKGGIKNDAIMALVALGGLLAGLFMGDDDFEDKSEETKGCVSLCLPSNYQDYYYGNIPKEELEYRTLESARTEFPNLEIYEEQPFCTADTKDCYEYCKVKCFNLFAEEDEQFKQDQEQDDENADDGEDPDYTIYMYYIAGILMAITLLIVVMNMVR